ncbi:DNA-binding transcriptional regulator CytR [Kordiimonas sediminis]|uniref:DNA-binding transcriptional regulator CytR n=1 Tax=Kordiimonas sediminis TaxID=1735581 RepID=A0A919E4Q0_9PROT|nr:LacI family DNA-binding transcriptional regulator [Kordiimonas sediminis]GHF13398.1 DNA-binding transcriptional regulator CytR [Kordiimonas sediminis]
MTNIRAVSKLAGVSVATVSRALRKPEMVSKNTREKVLSAAKTAGYKPNMMARNFRSKKSYSVMVLVPDISNPFFSMVIRGVQTAAKNKGYSVLLGNTMGDVDAENELAHMLHTNQTDGIIQLSARNPLAPEDRGDTAAPIVNCCECLGDGSMPTVSLDNVGASKAMTEHLLTLGHKKIAVITGPYDSPLTTARLSGYSAAVEAANLTVDYALVKEGDYSPASGATATKQLLAQSVHPTAILCFNDEMAIGAMQSIRQAGHKVPADISVTGFDDLPLSAYTHPPLTTIAQPTEEFGASAMAILFDLMDGQEPAERNRIVPYKLIVRDSTGPAKK